MIVVKSTSASRTYGKYDIDVSFASNSAKEAESLFAFFQSMIGRTIDPYKMREPKQVINKQYHIGNTPMLEHNGGQA